MRLRVSDNDIINIDSVDFIEMDGRYLLFHSKGVVYKSIYNNEFESQSTFNNINNYLTVTDARFTTEQSIKEEDKRKSKGFSMFWSMYDKRVDEKNCRTSFMRLTLEDMGKAIKGVKDYVDSTPDKKYRKNPRTWINQKGWESEVVISEDDKKKTNRYIQPKYVTDDR
tara:strand:- start:347 stop:850 length:504 start_codon:yes stop_codon:yes gene_type:complete